MIDFKANKINSTLKELYYRNEQYNQQEVRNVYHLLSWLDNYICPEQNMIDYTDNEISPSSNFG